MVCVLMNESTNGMEEWTDLSERVLQSANEELGTAFFGLELFFVALLDALELGQCACLAHLVHVVRVIGLKQN